MTVNPLIQWKIRRVVTDQKVIASTFAETTIPNRHYQLKNETGEHHIIEYIFCNIVGYSVDSNFTSFKVFQMEQLQFQAKEETRTCSGTYADEFLLF